LCAGLIGWRSLKMTEQAERIGIYGFGAAAHIITQVAKFQGRSVYAFTSPGDTKRQKFAMELGAQWSGGSDQAPPELLDAAIIFAPVGSLVPKALSDIRKGGSVVCGGIHMSDIPMFPYKLLWGERSVSSVANLTRADGIEFFDIATSTNIVSHVTEYDLEQANQAVIDVRQGKIHGAAVLVPGRIA
jgi:alcohol dehydrogenase, propanol-preferring